MSRPVGGNTTTTIAGPCDGSLSRQSGSALFTTYPTNGPIRSPRTAIRSPRDRGARRGSATCRPRLVPTVERSTGRPLRSPCYLHGVGGAIVGDASSHLARCSRTPDSMAVSTIHRSGRPRGARPSHRTNVTQVGRWLGLPDHSRGQTRDSDATSEVELVGVAGGELEAAVGAAVGGLGGPADSGDAEVVHREQGTREDAFEQVRLGGFELDEPGQDGEQVDELGGPVGVPHLDVDVVQRGGLLPEVVPGLVDFEVAVPRLTAAVG